MADAADTAVVDDTPWVFHGMVTCVVVFVSFLAFDDITTGQEPTFGFEYAALVGCAAWLLFLSVRLVRREHPWLGALSLAVLLGAGWGQRGVGPGITPSLPEYVAVIGAFVWFGVLALALFGLDWRASRLTPDGRE